MDYQEMYAFSHPPVDILDARCYMSNTAISTHSDTAMSVHRRPIPALKPDKLNCLPLEILHLRLQQANLVTMGSCPQLVRQLKEQHHLPVVQPLCLPQCLQVQVRPCVPQL